MAARKTSHAVAAIEIQGRDDHDVVRAEGPDTVGLKRAQRARPDDHAEQGQDPVTGRQGLALGMSRDPANDTDDQGSQDARAAALQPRVGMERERDRYERDEHDHAEQPPCHCLERRRALAVVPPREPAAPEPVDERVEHRHGKR